MGLFTKKIKKGGFHDIIRCDQKDYLIWKWHPEAFELGESKREFAIRTGSILRVKDGEVAVFVYKQKNGTMQDYIVGPFDQKIKTGNFPVLQSIIGMFYEGDTPFQAEIYFINLAYVLQSKFAVPFFNVCDPFYPHFSIPVAVRGTITFRIEDYKQFIKCHRMDTFTYETFQQQLKDVVNRYVKDAVANAPAKHNIPVVSIESKTAMINDIVEIEIKERLKEDFGVSVTGVDIGHIELDKTCDEYAELKTVTKDISLRKAQADILNYEEQLRIQREEGQYATHMATKSANLGAYQTQKQAEVGIAGAQALGKMGENNVGNVDLGGGSGLNPMTMMAGMALGSAVGQNIAGTMNQAMQGVTPGAVPPPVPTIAYHVAKDGKDVGSYNLQQLSEMISKGEINRDTLVWKQGMSSWIKAKDAEEIKGLFPPELPIE